MKKLLPYCCAICLLPSLVSADDKPVETLINKVRVGGSLSFNYSKPIFKGIDSTTGYSLIPRISLGPVNKSGGSAYKGPLKFVLRPRIGFFKQGYDASDSAQLSGMRDRDSSFNVGLKLHTRTPVGSFVLSGAYDVIGKHDGFVGSLMYTNLLPLSASKLRIYPEVGLSYWSSKASDYYYGVESDEIQVGRTLYDLDSTTNFFLGYRMEYPLTKKWGLTHSLRSTWYDDDILDSPIVDEDADSELKATFGISYDF
jgi:outer membrane scaffolding protein for murein synthesis (MipA/OmpV family)